MSIFVNFLAYVFSPCKYSGSWSRPITVIPPPSAVSQIQKPVPPPRLHPDQQQQLPTASPRRDSIAARTRTPSPKPSFFQVCKILCVRVVTVIEFHSVGAGKTQQICASQ